MLHDAALFGSAPEMRIIDALGSMMLAHGIPRQKQRVADVDGPPGINGHQRSRP